MVTVDHIPPPDAPHGHRREPAHQLCSLQPVNHHNIFNSKLKKRNANK